MNRETLISLFQRLIIAAISGGGAVAIPSCASYVVPTGSDADATCAPLVEAYPPCSAQLTYECGPPLGIVVGEVIDQNVCVNVCPSTNFNGESPSCTAYRSDAGETIVYCNYHCGLGRRVHGTALDSVPADGALQTFLANHARLEHASIAAFEQLVGELTVFRAPQELVDDMARAADEERDHAMRVRSQAERFGAVVTFEPSRRLPLRSIFDVAKNNLVEGCIREMFGALCLAWQVEHVDDRELAAMYQRLAVDETGHAAASMALHQWLSSKLNANEIEQLSTLREIAIDALRGEVRRETDDRIAVPLGMPNGTVAGELLESLVRSVWF